MEKKETQRQRDFCRAYLRTMDPERAAGESGCGDGFAMLATKAVRERLEKMRTAAADQICREDVLPCHLGVEFYFRYLTWQECEALGTTWAAVEAAEHTWESFELTVPPEEA